jgi:hypothetical protein
MKISAHFFLLALSCVIFWGCKKEYIGNYSLIQQIPEPAGENCRSGGLKVISGIDLNSNKVLDSNEIQQTNYVCNGTYDKETILYFPSAGIGHDAYTTTGEVSPDDEAIKNFNIANYPADSISFSAYMGTSDVTINALVELYDLTNNRVIPNTTLASNSKTFETKTTTVNFIKDLPNASITLAVRVRPEKAGANAMFYVAGIKLYKK